MVKFHGHKQFDARFTNSKIRGIRFLSRRFRATSSSPCFTPDFKFQLRLQMSSAWLRRFCRSPHLYESLILTSSAFAHSLTVNLICLQADLSQVVNYFLLGLVFFSLIEYWFHRTILHEWIFKVAHVHHHEQPAKLRIICTPLLPVVVYGIVVCSVLGIIWGPQVAVGVMGGLTVSQMLMDLVHVAEHSSWRPWWLHVSRDWHAYHHKRDHWNEAHGLTCFFWDNVFGSWPREWSLYQRYPIIRYLQLPLPLISSIYLAPLMWRSKRADAVAAEGPSAGTSATQGERGDEEMNRVTGSLPTLETAQIHLLIQALVMGTLMPWASWMLSEFVTLRQLLSGIKSWLTA